MREKEEGNSYQHPQPPHYGTFQGGHPPPPVIGFPQPTPPPGAVHPHPDHPYPHGYQSVPGYAVAKGRPVREPRLPCCGIGHGWFLFILGFFLAAMPWYLGALLLLCSRVDYREKPGFVACTIAGALAGIAIIIGATEGVF